MNVLKLIYCYSYITYYNSSSGIQFYLIFIFLVQNCINFKTGISEDNSSHYWSLGGFSVVVVLNFHDIQHKSALVFLT